MTLIPLAGLQDDPATQQANRDRQGRRPFTDNCFICGRGLTEKARINGWWVHLHTDGLLIPNGSDVDDAHGSQGWFPIGAKCAGRVPRTHRFKS